MTDGDLVTRLLGTAGEDVGCEGGLMLLAEYVEGELAGREQAGEALLGVAEHLRNCPACSEDYEGLVALVRARRDV
jgi:predicted anti-sigma-YlaC factor YlaD